MRKKIISLSIAITLLLCTILHTSITVKAAEDELYRYRETLEKINEELGTCLLYTSPSPRDRG